MNMNMNQPILTNSANNTIVECRCDGARTVVETDSRNTAFTTYFDDPIVVRENDTIALTLGVVNSTSGTGDTIEIIEGVNDTGLVKLCFYYGDYQDIGPATPIADLDNVYNGYDSARLPQYNTYTLTDSSAITYQSTKVGGRPFSPLQIQRYGAQSSPHTQISYHKDGGTYRPHYPATSIITLNDDDPDVNTPYESVFTIVVPPGFYSPSNLADFINKYIQQTFVKKTLYNCLFGEYSPPNSSTVKFYPEIGIHSINRMTMLKYPVKLGLDYSSGSIDGRNYTEYAGGNTPTYYQEEYGMWCVDEFNGGSDPNGVDYGNPAKNWAKGGMVKGIWEQPFLIGGLFAQFNFNANSSKFEWSNLHTPIPASSTGTNPATSTTVLTPSYGYFTFDLGGSSNFCRSIVCAVGGCGIKLKGKLWETCGFTPATDAEWNYQIIDNTYVDSFNYTITDPFGSTQFGMVNVEPSGSNAHEFSTQTTFNDVFAGAFPFIGTFTRFNPNITVQLSDANSSSGNPIPKQYGERYFNWNSTTYAADNYPDKVSGGYYLVQSDILGNDLAYLSESGKKLPIVGVLMKNYALNDYYFSFNSLVPFVSKSNRTIRSIYVRLLNPDFSTPTNLGGRSAVFFNITSQYTSTQFPMLAAPPSSPDEPAKSETRKKKKKRTLSVGAESRAE